MKFLYSVKRGASMYQGHGKFSSIKLGLGEKYFECLVETADSGGNEVPCSKDTE